MLVLMELKMPSEWPGFTPINIKFFQPIVHIMAIQDLRLMQLGIQEGFQMSLVLDMCTSGDHIYIELLFGQQMRQRNHNEH